MGWVMMRTARSPIFSQAHDYSCFIADANGILISQADGIPIHTGGGGFANNASATGLTASNQGYTTTNILSVGAHVDIKPLEQTLIQPGIAWMKFHEDVFSQVDSLTSPLQTDDELGFSAYVRLNQGITDGLALKATFGYLFAGDAYSVLTDDDDAYKFATGLFWSW